MVVVRPDLFSFFSCPYQIQFGTAVCREVVNSPLESIRERFADRAKKNMARLSGLEKQLDGITEKV